jgi:hypothetical protein
MKADGSFCAKSKVADQTKQTDNKKRFISVDVLLLCFHGHRTHALFENTKLQTNDDIQKVLP